MENFNFLQDLGHGSFATAQLCKYSNNSKNDNNNQLYVLKVYNMSLLKHIQTITSPSKDKNIKGNGINHIYQEIAIMKKLNHPNIILLYEVLDNNTDKMALVLEYAANGPLMNWDPISHRYLPNKSIIKEKNKLIYDGIECKYLFHDIVQGLIYLHDNEICHRDLKPENILINNLNKCKIADFGTAHDFANNKNKVNKNTKILNQLTDTCGTYAFLSPESLNGMPFCGYKADIWSLGVVLYTMLFGYLPFYENNILDLFDAIEQKETIIHPKEIYTNQYKDSNLPNEAIINDDLVDLLNRMLEKDPLKRITLNEIENHPWLIKDIPMKEKKIDKLELNKIDIKNAIVIIKDLSFIVNLKYFINEWKRKDSK